jgi:hypothetical protein
MENVGMNPEISSIDPLWMTTDDSDPTNAERDPWKRKNKERLHMII